MRMNRGEYREKILPLVVASGITAGCAVSPGEVAPSERIPIECTQPCQYELVVERDIGELEETQAFKMLNSMAMQLHYRLEPKDFISCFVRVGRNPYFYFHRDGFSTGALEFSIDTPQSFFSPYELALAKSRAQTELKRRVGFPITFDRDGIEKRQPTMPQDFLVNDPIMGRIFDAGLQSSTVSLQNAFRGMPSVFLSLPEEQKVRTLTPILERESLRMILFPGNVSKGNSLMGSGFEASLGRYKTDLAKGSSALDFASYIKLDPIEEDISTLLAHTLSGSYGHGLTQ